MNFLISIKARAKSIRKTFSRTREQKSVYDLIIKWCLYLIVLLVPIFFWPLASDWMELPKVFLFYFLVLVAVVAWLTKILVKKEPSFVSTFLDVPIVIFGLIYFLGTVFSIDRYNSLVGGPGYFSETLLTTLFLILFYFLLTNNVRSREEVKKLIALFLVSTAGLVIFNLFQFLGLYFLPWSQTRDYSFDLVVGSGTILTAVLGAAIPLILGLLISQPRRAIKWLLLTLLALDLILILIINSFIGLGVLIVALFILNIAWASRSTELPSYWLVSITLILALTVLAFFIPFGKLAGIILPTETNLPLRTSGQIVWSSIGDYPLLGVGPENFSYALAHYRPIEFNRTRFWNLNFNRANNFWFNLLADLGPLGTLVFLVISLWYLVRIFKNFLRPAFKEKAEADWYFGVGFFIAWFSLLVFSFLYSFSFVTIFLFWLFLALGIIWLRGEKKRPTTLRLTKAPKPSALAFLYSFSFSLVVILGIWFVYLAGRYLLADYYFVRAANLAVPFFSGESKLEPEEIDSRLTRVNDYFTRAIKLNPYEKNYYFGLARVTIVRLQFVALEGNEKNQFNLNDLIKSAFAEVAQGLSLGKNSASAYLSAINMYQDLRGLVGPNQIDPLILNTETDLVKLDPNNPQAYLNRGQLYWEENQLIKNNLATIKDDKVKQTLTTQADNLLNQAEQDFSRALSLKSDLLVGYDSLALVKEAKSQPDEAIKLLNQALGLNPYDYQSLYNLGRIYLGIGKLDEATSVLTQLVSIYPNDSNGHWQLSVAYEKKGDRAKALAEMEIVARLNPTNDMVKNKLEELKKK